MSRVMEFQVSFTGKVEMSTGFSGSSIFEYFSRMRCTSLSGLVRVFCECGLMIVRVEVTAFLQGFSNLQQNPTLRF